LVNESKKGYYFQQKLLAAILDWYRVFGDENVKTADLTRAIAGIKDTLEEAKVSGNDQLGALQDLLKRCLSIAFLANSSQDNFLAYKQTAATLKLYYGQEVERGSLFYLLAGSYGQYVFDSGKKQDIDDGINKTLQKLALPKDMSYVAPSFTFFLSQYIEKDITPSENLFGIVEQMFITTSAYSKTLDNNASKYVTLATNYYYNTSILNHLYDSILDTFFENSTQGKTLKAEYVYENGDISVPSYVVEGVASFASGSSEDFRFSQRMFYSLKRAFAPKDQRDDFAGYAQAFKKMGELSTIFSDYKSYQRQLALDPESRSITELSAADDQQLTSDYPQQFLSQFNNVTASSVRILNNYRKDGYFRISAEIFGNTFTFGLRPDGNRIFEVVLIRADGTRDEQFKELSFSADQKKATLEELYQGAASDDLRYWYDYKNMFETVFLVDDATLKQTLRPASETQTPTNAQKMTPEMQVFVQQNLIEGDFKRISSLFPIGFKNVYAEISSGKYQITLSNIE